MFKRLISNWSPLFDYKKSKISNAKRLNSHLAVVQEMISETDFDWVGKHPVFYFIDSIVNYENSKRFSNVTGSTEIHTSGSFDYYFQSFSLIRNQEYRELPSGKYNLDFSDEVILTNIWNKERVIRTISNIGSGRVYPTGASTEWTHHDINHYSVFYFPLSFAKVTNGNHSIYSGMIKRKGVLNLTNLCDLSWCYEEFKFDGDQFITKDNMSREPVQYEAGLLFEVGRILMKNQFVFRGHPQEGLLHDHNLI